MSGDVHRYHRQMLLPGWGEDTQRRLSESSALVVGVGALGSVSAELLVRAGVGRVVLADRDVVELTNLQRQLLYSEDDLGRAKAVAAADRLRRINSGVMLKPVVEDLRGERVLELTRGAGVIVDGTDNFETRYVLNDAAVACGVPMVYGGAVGTAGMVLPVVPGVGPCLRCVSGELPVATATCDTAGVLGPVTAMVGARQASIALQLLTGRDVRPLLESIDGLGGEGRLLDVTPLKDGDCECCVRRRFEFLERDDEGAVVLCGRDSVQVTPAGRRRLDTESVVASLRAHGSFDADQGVIRGRFAAERGERGEAIGLFVFGDGRAIVSGTSDPARARSVYARYVGA